MGKDLEKEHYNVGSSIGEDLEMGTFIRTWGCNLLEWDRRMMKLGEMVHLVESLEDPSKLFKRLCRIPLGKPQGASRVGMVLPFSPGEGYNSSFILGSSRRCLVMTLRSQRNHQG